VSFAAITLSVTPQQVFIIIVVYLSTQSENFWIHLPITRYIFQLSPGIAVEDLGNDERHQNMLILLVTLQSVHKEICNDASKCSFLELRIKV